MVLQALLNGLVEACVIAIAATGLSLLYGVKKFANFAHGEMMTVGAYVALFIVGATRASLAVGILGAVVLLALFSLFFEFLIFSRLEGRGPVAPLVASVGLALILQNAVRLAFGTTQVTYGLRLPDDWLLGVRDPLTGFQVSVNPLKDLVPMIIGIAVVLLLVFLLKYTKLGKAMRATADNPDLARVSGIHVGLVRYSTWALAGGLAGAAGVVFGMRLTVLLPDMGAGLLLIVFSAVILGGIGSPYGAMLGSLVIGVARNLFYPVATALGVSTDFSLVVPFGIMVLVLLLRPQGIAGRPLGFDLPPLRAELRKLWQTFLRVVRRRTSDG